MGILRKAAKAVARDTRDYVKGSTTRGTCGDCGHGATAVGGCRCSAGWCPCHRGAYGHGGHGCTPDKH